MVFNGVVGPKVGVSTRRYVSVGVLENATSTRVIRNRTKRTTPTFLAKAWRSPPTDSRRFDDTPRWSDPRPCSRPPY